MDKKLHPNPRFEVFLQSIQEPAQLMNLLSRHTICLSLQVDQHSGAYAPSIWFNNTLNKVSK